jgi:hypothetical protein
MDRRTKRQQVIEECQKIETLLLLLAEAAKRRFAAPIDDPDFETTDGPNYANAVGLLRHYIEIAAQIPRGTDPDLDMAMHKYSIDCICNKLRDAQPVPFQIN